jgi:hypothetical protein
VTFLSDPYTWKSNSCCILVIFFRYIRQQLVMNMTWKWQQPLLTLPWHMLVVSCSRNDRNKQQWKQIRFDSKILQRVYYPSKGLHVNNKICIVLICDRNVTLNKFPFKFQPVFILDYNSPLFNHSASICRYEYKASLNKEKIKVCARNVMKVTHKLQYVS